jgi:hypothetical protein
MTVVVAENILSQLAAAGYLLLRMQMDPCILNTSLPAFLAHMASVVAR